MIQHYWATFVELIATPFDHAALIWGIVPLYFGLLLNELTADKASFRTALQSGFSFLWAGAQWLWPYFVSRGLILPRIELNAGLPVTGLGYSVAAVAVLSATVLVQSVLSDLGLA